MCGTPQCAGGSESQCGAGCQTLHGGRLCGGGFLHSCRQFSRGQQVGKRRYLDSKGLPHTSYVHLHDEQCHIRFKLGNKCIKCRTF